MFLEDGPVLNELNIKVGHGKVVTYPPDVKYAERLMEAHVKPIRVVVNLSNVQFQNFEIM